MRLKHSIQQKNKNISSATNTCNIMAYSVEDKVQRYIHSLMPEIADILEAEGYDVNFEETNNTWMISIYPSGEDFCDGTYSFPKSALDHAGFDVHNDANHIVEILMGRAQFEDYYDSKGCINCNSLEDKRNPDRPYRYITKHGIGPGTLPRDVHLMDWEDIDDYRTAIYLDRPLSTKELNEYDIYPESIQASSECIASSVDIKSEANRLFNCLKDYGALSIKNNIDTIDITFSNDPSISDVDMIYYAIQSEGYSFLTSHNGDPYVFEFIRDDGCICVKLLSYNSSNIVVEVSLESEYISSSYEWDDEEVSEWEEVASKLVPDTDGFYTDYTLYRNVIDGQYICMFGDKDIYEPDMDYADWYGDSEKEARQWFDTYTGYDEEDPYDDYLHTQTGIKGLL